MIHAQVGYQFRSPSRQLLITYDTFMIKNRRAIGKRKKLRQTLSIPAHNTFLLCLIAYNLIAIINPIGYSCLLVYCVIPRPFINIVDNYLTGLCNQEPVIVWVLVDACCIVTEFSLGIDVLRSLG